jgi:hypothetical protein
VKDRLRIAVTGMVATYPFGGVFWDYMQYVYGLHLLGHDVLYVEDTGKWCYDPVSQTFVEDGSRNAQYLARHVAALDPLLEQRWFYRDGAGQTYGRSWADVAAFCRSADIFLHISASCCLCDEYLEARRVVFLDSDPMYTQASIPGYVLGTLDPAARARVDMLRQHDVFFTFAENIGGKDCRVPTEMFRWIPTRQPVVDRCFAESMVAVTDRRPVFTTVASWEPNEQGPVVNGVTYSGKSTEFLKFMELPRLVPATLEVALSGRPPRERLVQAGWNVIDAYGVSSDPWRYREYLATSLGEWSVAKNAYVLSRSGWFSCRTACYLALGVPAVVQNTAFASDIPVGRGLLTFDSMAAAIDGIQQVMQHPHGHATEAREICAEFFDSQRVLNQLIDAAMDSDAGSRGSQVVAVDHPDLCEKRSKSG